MAYARPLKPDVHSQSPRHKRRAESNVGSTSLRNINAQVNRELDPHLCKTSTRPKPAQAQNVARQPRTSSPEPTNAEDSNLPRIRKATKHSILTVFRRGATFCFVALHLFNVTSERICDFIARSAQDRSDTSTQVSKFNRDRYHARTHTTKMHIKSSVRLFNRTLNAS